MSVPVNLAKVSESKNGRTFNLVSRAWYQAVIKYPVMLLCWCNWFSPFPLKTMRLLGVIFGSEYIKERKWFSKNQFVFGATTSNKDHPILCPLALFKKYNGT